LAPAEDPANTQFGTWNKEKKRKKKKKKKKKKRKKKEKGKKSHKKKRKKRKKKKKKTDLNTKNQNLSHLTRPLSPVGYSVQTPRNGGEETREQQGMEGFTSSQMTNSKRSIKHT